MKENSEYEYRIIESDKIKIKIKTLFIVAPLQTDNINYKVIKRHDKMHSETK